MNIEPDQPTRLDHWLAEAAVGIAIWPSSPDTPEPLFWRVEVNNGLGGHAGAGSTLAMCKSEEDAELVAAALWTYVAHLRAR